MKDNELGSYLRLLRIKNNLTMTQTAEKTGITQGYISQIENGIYSPSAKTLARLARTYNVPEIHLLRKAGIVQLSSAPEEGMSSVQESEPLVEISDTGEMMEMIKRGLASLEYLGDQLRLRGQLANMPQAQPTEAVREDLGAEMTLPLYDGAWQPLTNAAGEHAGMRLPAYMCNDDADAFVLVSADDSMVPIIKRGDWVVISPGTEPESGQIVAINDRNQIQLRIYSATDTVISLMPANGEFAAKNLLLERSKDKVEIVGRALRIVNHTL